MSRLMQLTELPESDKTMKNVEQNVSLVFVVVFVLGYVFLIYKNLKNDFTLLLPLLRGRYAKNSDEVCQVVRFSQHTMTRDYGNCIMSLDIGAMNYIVVVGTLNVNAPYSG